MALTYGGFTPIYRGRMTENYVEITADSAYAPGGETINASDLGLTTIKGITILSVTAGWNAQVVRSSDTVWLLKFFLGGASVTTSASTGTPIESNVRDFSTVITTVRALGIS